MIQSLKTLICYDGCSKQWGSDPNRMPKIEIREKRVSWGCKQN
ncbi:MAG: hypothetical protein ACLTZT_11310 [Butyricimonas faecalis]